MSASTSGPRSSVASQRTRPGSSSLPATARHTRTWRSSSPARQAGRLPEGLAANVPVLPADPKGMATRAASGKVLNALAPASAGADRRLRRPDAVEPDRDQRRPGLPAAGQRAARYLRFGVREHAMGAILNGLALHGGLIPYGGTFLVFADYMRPAIRLAGIMKPRVIYVFTHDFDRAGRGRADAPADRAARPRCGPSPT